MTDAKQPAGHSGIERLTDASAPDFLEAHELAMLVFVAADDEACATVLERVAAVQEALGGTVAVGAIDVDASPFVARAVGVKRVPEVLVFGEGENVDRFMGVVPEHVMQEALEQRAKALRTAPRASANDADWDAED